MVLARSISCDLGASLGCLRMCKPLVLNSFVGAPIKESVLSSDGFLAGDTAAAVQVNPANEARG